MAFCLMLTLAPAALAVEADETDVASPYITDMSFTINGTTYVSEAYGSSAKKMSIPVGTVLDNFSMTLETSEPVTFLEADSPVEGCMYVRDVDTENNSVDLNLKANVSGIDMSSSLASVTLEPSVGNTWVGGPKFGEATSLVNIPISAVATALRSYSASGLQAGSMQSVATGETNAFQRILCNQDNVHVVLITCLEDTDVYTVTYDCGNATYVWQLPAGAPMIKPTLPDDVTQPEGWYTDADFTTPLSDDAVVTENTTLYAKFPSSGSSFEEQITGTGTLTISSLADFNVFAQRASEIAAGRRVELAADIDCDGASYTALTFAGDFDGKGHTISNATFKANGNNSGMFATIGAGQKIVNLKLSGITAEYADNAGILAGSISASGSARALIQNVQIRGGEVEGRNTGALVGYTFLSDIKYCSSRDVALSGLINVGGIAGISYSQITYCYSICDLPSSNFIRKTGGIVAKNLEASNVERCWCTASTAVGQSGTDSAASNNFTGVDQWTAAVDFEDEGFTQNCWALDDGTDTSFNDSVVTYSFES